MSERENILGRIREALRAQAPVPGAAHDHSGHPAHAVSEAEAAKHISEWLPAVGDTFDQQVELFRTNALDLKAEFHLLERFIRNGGTPPQAGGRRSLEKCGEPFR